MGIETLNPYLNFNGNATEAIRLYEKALGAQVESISHFSDGPFGELPEERKGLVLHACLKIGSGRVMISDTTPECAVPLESNTVVMLEFSTPAEVDQAFGAMSEGAKVQMPVSDTFWGARFGMLRDRYGIGWMFSCMKK